MCMMNEIMSQVVTTLKIGSEGAIIERERIGCGLSGAEVYRVRLGSSSTHKGFFILKIDLDDKEFKAVEVGVPFKMARCLERACIDDKYYVFLYELAGGSCYDFNSFRAIISVSERDKITKQLLSNHLKYTQNIEQIIRADSSPNTVMHRLLGNKIDKNSCLFRYFVKHFGATPEKTMKISICNAILPNPYAYAFAEEPWEGVKFEDCVCPMHGDMHGENIFISKKGDDACLIDIALARNDGYAFFDTAYFELSELLGFLAHDPISSWIRDMEMLSKCEWENLDCRGKSFAWQVAEAEKLWIEETYNKEFSHKDCLSKARLLARVMVGLNYAGKGNVCDDMRMKAFIYAASFLQQLIERCGLDKRQVCTPVEWKEGVSDELERENIKKLSEFAGGFKNYFRYFLVSGQNQAYTDVVCTLLSRIPWSGVISFQIDPDINSLHDAVGHSRLLKDILLHEQGNLEYIKNSSVWWLYALGYKALPQDVVDSFSQWSRKYSIFMHSVMEAIGAAVGPSEAVVIIDIDSFEGKEKFYERILEHFNNQKLSKIALLGEYRANLDVNVEDYPDIEIQKFDISMANLAKFCREVLGDVVTPKVIVPNMNEPCGVVLEEEDRKFIEEDLTLVCDALLFNENIDSLHKDDFFYGEPICWTAINEKRYVPRKQIECYGEEVQSLLADRKQVVFNITYEPGAGATVICKAICWHLRNSYPTVVVKKLTDNTREALQRLASVSGKSLLLLVDNDFSTGLVDRLFSIMRTCRIKGVILYPNRTYSERVEADDSSCVKIISRPDDVGNRLTIRSLSRDEAQNFEKWFAFKLSDKYSDTEEINRRKRNLKGLTFDTTMKKFCKPFFYGMYAFEKDFISIESYINNIIKRLGDDVSLSNAVKYIALVTYYITTTGIKYTFAKYILGMQNDKKMNEGSILKLFSEKFGALILLNNSEYRICHPLIAKEILDKFHNNSNHALKKTCEDFTSEFCEFEGRDIPSNALNELAMDMFIKREQEKEYAKFSQVILDIKDPMLQEGFFKHLTRVFPGNAHFFQHYGRLIVNNRAYDIESARPQFDEAIRLEKNNPHHYHARGTMFFKKIKHILSGRLSSADIYAKCKVLTDCALEDFRQAIEIVRSNCSSGISVDMFLYPYSSILDVTTFVAQNMKYAEGEANFKNVFLAGGAPAAKWCRELIATANQHDADIVNIYSELSGSAYYGAISSRLHQLNYTSAELMAKIRLFPTDTTLKYAYVNVADCSTQGRSSGVAKDVIVCCEKILEKDYKHEGILWKWFVAQLNSGILVWEDAFGLLQSLHDLDKNQTANFLLYVLYFCKFIETNHRTYAVESSKCMSVCRTLAKNNSKSTSSKLFYAANNSLQLVEDHNDMFIFNGTINREIKSTQSGYVALDIHPGFEAFFVPAHTDLKKEQSFNCKVKFSLGFSYDGLRAFDVIKSSHKEPTTLLR